MDGYDFIVEYFLERYQPLPDITLCCHKNKTKKRVHYSRYGRKERSDPIPDGTYGRQYIDRKK